MTQKAVKRNGIVPNETKWPPSRKAKQCLIGKNYSISGEEESVTLPVGFQRPEDEIVELVESLIPELNNYNISKCMRTVKLQFDCDGSITASALKNEGKLRSEIKKASKGVPGGFRRSFNGSPSEVGDVIDGTFKHAFENSESMSPALQISKIHPVFDVEVKGSCDGMIGGRPIEVKSVNSITDYNLMKTLNGNLFQFAAYNWLYGQSPLIVIVSRENLDIMIVEPTQDMVNSSMEEWEQWRTDKRHDNPGITTSNHLLNSPLVKLNSPLV
jgi:hypothetical protein